MGRDQVLIRRLAGKVMHQLSLQARVEVNLRLLQTDQCMISPCRRSREHDDLLDTVTYGFQRQPGVGLAKTYVQCRRVVRHLYLGIGVFPNFLEKYLQCLETRTILAFRFVVAERWMLPHMNPIYQASTAVDRIAICVVVRSELTKSRNKCS